MAEPTPTELYQDFCDEDTLLTASIGVLEAAPTLDNLDELSAAKTRLALVREAMPALCAASERYEAGERIAAILAVQGPRWASAAGDKSTALASVATLLAQLKSAVDAYAAAHGAQVAVLHSVPLYSAQYRVAYSPMVSRLVEIVQVVVRGDMTWLSRVSTFDTMGCNASLPTE